MNATDGHHASAGVPWRFALVSAAIALLPWVASAQQADVIRGRVTGPDNLPIFAASITATSASGNVTRSTRSDRSGHFTIIFPGGEGDYFITVTSIGLAPKRFEVRRAADEDILVADAKLSSVTPELDAVRVTAGRRKPMRNDTTPDIGGTERATNWTALDAAQLGNLAALAASVPGVVLVPGVGGDPSGFSVLGLDPLQNNTTVNGMNADIGTLPRDAAITGSLVTAPYDVSLGGFSGGQQRIQTVPGSNFTARSMTLHLNAPQLEWSDPVGRDLGQDYTNISLGGRASGPIALDKAFYSFSYQFDQVSHGVRTLLNSSPLALETAGIAPDSVTRLIGLLSQAGVPVTVGGIPRQQVSDAARVFGTFDLAPPSAPGGQAFNITYSGNVTTLAPASPLGGAMPAYGGRASGWNGELQVHHSVYFGVGILSETGVSASESRGRSVPYLALPSAALLVNSIFSDSTTGTETVYFGGNPALNTSRFNTTFDFTNGLSWFSDDNAHRVKLTTEVRHERYSIDQSVNQLGTYFYNSLADLDANNPASFTRQLGSQRQDGSQLIGAMSLGDSYRPNANLQIQYGVRVDGNQYESGPRPNGGVAQLFGTRNDYEPNRLYLSPRVGFSLRPGAVPQPGAFGSVAQTPRAVVRGGIGLFQGIPSTALLGPAMVNTGLASAEQQLDCVGVAVPIPNWAEYASNPSSVPTQCAAGAGSAFANATPNVTLVDRRYTAPRSLRSNLQWTGPLLNSRFIGTLGVLYSLNMNQSSSVDLNFADAPQFTLPGEGNRPVYVQESSIDPATGLFTTGGAGRRSTAYDHVTELRSDLTSHTQQLNLALGPARGSSRFTWNVAYVYQRYDDRVRGFNGTTAGDPFDVQSGRASGDWRHMIQYQLFANLFDFVSVNWSQRFMSGVPYTPVVVGDINGDGYANNDRAFVFDPAHTADPTLAAAMRTLLAGSPTSARTCLLAQLGTIAGRNTCNGPWTSSASLTFSFNPLKVRLPRRGSLTFQVGNPLGAADLLLHGKNHLQGWGQPASPDPSLLYVQGYNPQTHAYQYTVNQRFGSTNPAFNLFRVPVTLTVMLSYDLAAPREQQALTQQLDRGRVSEGSRVTSVSLKQLYGSGPVLNPLAAILGSSDSLRLSSPQADTLATLNRQFLIVLDSIWTPVAAYLGALPDVYDRKDAYDHYRSAREASIDLLIRLAPVVRALLSNDQRRKLPLLVIRYLDPQYLRAVRSDTAGETGSLLLPGGGIAIPVPGNGIIIR